MSKSSGKRFSIQRQPYVAALLVASVVAVVSFGAFTLLKNLYPKADRVKADTVVNTGKGRVTAVDLTQVGTGASVTIDNSNQTVDGKSLDETTYGTNTTRRTVLNNNIVRYRVRYEVTTPGTVTLQFTMPANSVIDKASIASCADGSAMTSATTDNLHADINKGWGGYSEASKPEESHSYNQATCVMNYDMAGTYTWDISTRPWGGNGEKIVPEVEFNNETSTANAEAITIIGKPSYEIDIHRSDALGSADGYNHDTSLGIYFFSGAKSTLIYLGLEPLTQNLTITFDTSRMPAGMSDYWSNPMFPADGLKDCGKDCTAGYPKFNMTYNPESIVVSAKDILTGAAYCPSVKTNGVAINDVCYYAGYYPHFSIPISSLTKKSKTYSMMPTVSQVPLSTRSGSDYAIPLLVDNLSWSLSARAYGNPVVWLSRYKKLPVGAPNYIARSTVYSGENFNYGAWVQLNTVPSASYASNFYYCATWNAGQIELRDDFIVQTAYQSSAKVEYGVIGNTLVKRYSSSRTTCGKYGDEVDDNEATTPRKFFKTLAEANLYAASQGLRVNALRVYIDKLTSGSRDHNFGDIPVRFIGTTENMKYGDNPEMGASGETDDWRERSDGSSSEDDGMTGALTTFQPGIIRATNDFADDTVEAGALTDLEITPYTYNDDDNDAISTTLPNGLSIYSVTQGNKVLVENEDYRLTNSSDGEVTMTFTGKCIAGEAPTKDADGLPVAADDDGAGLKREKIIVKLRASPNLASGSTLTASSWAWGDGTNSTSRSFKSSSDSISVSAPSNFTYGLSASADSIHSGDSITYTANIRNSLDEATDDDGATLVNVLPFNGDSRGTTGLDSYTVKDISLAATNTGSGEAPTADVYYATSLDDAKKIDGATGEAAMKTAVDDAKWTKCELNGGKCVPSLADGERIRAVRIKTGKLSKNDSVIMRYTLGNIHSTDTVSGTGSVATIGNDVSYLTASLIDAGVHTFGGKVADLGDQMGLSLDKANVALSVTPGSTSTATLSGAINAKVNKGYTLTVTPSAEMKGAKDGHSFKKLSVAPTASSNGYNIKVSGGTASADWLTAANYADTQPRGQYNRSYTTNFTAAPSFATPADTYTGTITYTLTTGI